MKIQFTPDDKTRCGVIVEIQGDDLALPALIEELLIPALMAWGFAESTITEHLGERGEKA